MLLNNLTAAFFSLGGEGRNLKQIQQREICMDSMETVNGIARLSVQEACYKSFLLQIDTVQDMLMQQ